MADRQDTSLYTASFKLHWVIHFVRYVDTTNDPDMKECNERLQISHKLESMKYGTDGQWVILEKAASNLIMTTRVEEDDDMATACNYLTDVYPLPPQGGKPCQGPILLNIINTLKYNNFIKENTQENINNMCKHTGHKICIETNINIKII